jgi:flagellar protein FlgJ
VPVRERVPAPEPVPVPARAAAPGAPAAGATGSLRQEFIAAVRPHAERAAAELGVDPDLLIAQAALESGWGRSAMRRADGGSANNLFGIKAGSRWGGERVEASTREFQDGQPRAERAAFRAYASVADSFADYVDLLRSSPRYRDALAQAHDPEAFMQGLQSAGYATDPAYAQKVLRIWRRQVARA